MQRICISIRNAGYDVTLIGRELPYSKPLNPKPFKQIRWKMLFNSGKLFYLFFNLRLFIHYLFNKYHIIVANDLDTMAAGFLAAKFKRIPLVYDAHEYFPQLPEVVHRPFTHWVWQTLEKFTVPRTKYCYTINQSYANIFKKKYGKDFQIFRNIARLEAAEIPERKDKFILYQGAVNVGRGIEQMIEAMQFLDYKLVICGRGDVFEKCQQLSKQFKVEDKVEFKGFVPPEELRIITLQASLGFTFFTNDGDSYYYSLANRFFDYFHNGVPQLCMNYPEYAAINKQYKIAYLVDDLSVPKIVEAVNTVLKNPDYYNELAQNCLKARVSLSWQNEAKRLVTFYDKIAESL